MLEYVTLMISMDMIWCIGQDVAMSYAAPAMPMEVVTASPCVRHAREAEELSALILSDFCLWPDEDFLANEAADLNAAFAKVSRGVESFLCL